VRAGELGPPEWDEIYLRKAQRNRATLLRNGDHQGKGKLVGGTMECGRALRVR